MDRSKLNHLPNYEFSSNYEDIKIFERAEVEFEDSARYMLYVIGIRKVNQGFDIVHSISEKEGHAHVGLKYCPLENVIKYAKI